MRWLYRLSDAVNRGVEKGLFVLGLSMALVTGAQVFCRYGLNHSLFWSEEVGRMMLVWITFLGATSAYKRKAHVGIDLLVRRWPPGGRRTAEGAVLFLCTIFFVVLVHQGTAFILFAAGQKSAALGIPMALPYGVVPASGAIFLLHAASRLFQLIGSRTP